MGRRNQVQMQAKDSAHPAPFQAGTKRAKAAEILRVFFSTEHEPISCAALYGSVGGLKESIGPRNQLNFILNNMARAGEVVRVANPVQQPRFEKRPAEVGFIGRAFHDGPNLPLRKDRNLAQKKAKHKKHLPVAHKPAGFKPVAAPAPVKHANGKRLKMAHSGLTIVLHLQAKDVFMTPSDARNAYDQLRELFDMRYPL